MTTAFVQSERRGLVSVLIVDNPPVNALSQGVRQGLLDGLTSAVADLETRAIVLVCAGRTFVAGADITEFGKPSQPPGLPAIFDVIEASRKPVVAAIHGTALGGGLELAMTCHYRVALDSARFGQPEVKLGLIPGAGGTQRLPRLVGVEKALPMVAVGDPIGAPEALDRALIDSIVEGDLTRAGVEFATRVTVEPREHPRVRDRDEKLAAARGKPEMFEAFRASIADQTRGFLAPEAAVRAVEAAVTLPFDEGLARERELFAELMSGEQSRAMRYLFFAERRAARDADLAANRAVVVERLMAARAGQAEGISYPMIDAGAKLLEEGIVARASDIDVIAVNDCGWPRYEGGPMYFADTPEGRRR
jgi:3-hydroxyacyl-CoA dehydrogenase